MLEIINSLYQILGITQQANMGDVLGLASLLLILFFSLIKFLGKSPTYLQQDLKKIVETEKEIEEQLGDDDQILAKKIIETVESGVSWSERLRKGLQRSRNEVFGKIEGLFSKGNLSEQETEELEELLYSADLGPQIVCELMDELVQNQLKKITFGKEEFRVFFFDFLKNKMHKAQENVDKDLYRFDSSQHLSGRPKVIMIVGVNGAGKTTTIGKLATKFKNQGAKVVVGACDTFRAAAVEQLQVWCERAQVKMIRAKEGARPSGVAYEALQYAIHEKADYCILDTAGRLHTKENLMDELKKNKEVLKKLDPNAPDHVLLVIDAVTGQNALRQADEFNKTLGITGLIFTKCDGSSKAGSAVPIVEKLGVPIVYVGVGESVEDLDVFDLDEYLKVLLESNV